MAIADINDLGGVLGRPLELLIADTETVPAIAVSGARRLVDEGVVVVIGAGASSSTIAAAEQVLIPNGVLLISPSSTSPAIADLDDDDLVWRTVASDVFQGRLAAAWAYDSGHRTTGILYVDNAYGLGLSAAFTREFESLGGRVTAAIGYAELSSDEIVAFDYTRPVNGALEGNPDLIYLITYDQDGAKISVAAASHLSSDYRPAFLGCDGNTSQAFVDNAAPDVIDGMVGTLPIAPEDNTDYLAFVDQYTRLYGIEPESFSESTYDAVYLAALAMVAAESSEPQEIARELRAVSADGTPVTAQQFGLARDLLADNQDIDYRGAAGSLDFDEFGDILSGTYRIWRIENGSFTTIQTKTFP